MRIEYHRTLIADRVRIAAFHDALAGVIEKGRSVVVDVGTGTGILAMLAARLGAKKVYAYEKSEIGAVAERLIKANKVRNIEVIAARSTEIIDPPRGDIVVSETLGNYALEEFLVETMNDARARHLKPGGVLIPGALDQFVCPVIAPRAFDELAVWNEIGHGLDFSFARVMSLNNAYVRKFAPRELWDEGRSAVRWDQLDFSQRNRMSRKGLATWRAAHKTTVYGLALWWTAHLTPRVPLSTSPLDAATHWEQLYFPVLEPMPVERGEQLSADLRSHSSEEGGTDLAWTLTVASANGKQRSVQALSLEKGFLP
ncbi:MAG: 50S ribosomal protein L11 methyltransferase [Hyphomicrobiaceae bacterium]